MCKFTNLDLVASCSPLEGGFATTWVTIVREPLVSNEVLMIVTSGGVVRIKPPLESVVVRATGVESVISGCVVMVLVLAGVLGMTIVTAMTDECPMQLSKRIIVTRGRSRGSMR